MQLFRLRPHPDGTRARAAPWATNLMATRAAKRARAAQIAAFAGTSNRVIVKLLDELRREPRLLDEITDSRQLDNAAAAALREVEQVVELRREDGSDFQWVTASLPACLRRFARECPDFWSLLQRVYARRPCTPEEPYGIILYCDETVPGNIIALDNHRKIMGIYVSLADFGPLILKHECAWIPLAVLRTEVIKLLQGGFSCALKELLLVMFAGAGNVTEGFVVTPAVPADGGPLMLFLKLQNLLADELGLKMLWSSKGANGLFPCFCCANVTAGGDKGLAEDDADGFLVTIREADVSKFQLHTNEDHWTKADTLTAMRPRLNNTDFQQLERSLGLNYNPDGLLWCTALRPHVLPADVHTYDPTHSFICDGWVNTELGLLLRRLREQGVTFTELRVFMGADWRFCKVFTKSGQLEGCFSDARQRHFRKTGSFGSGPSETLAVVPALLFFLENSAELGAVFVDETASLQACNKVLGLYRRGKLGERVGDAMQTAFAEHAVVYDRAYGAEGSKAYKPKYHFSRHNHVDRDHQLLDTFVCERKHTLLKGVAKDCRNTSCFERSVLARALLQHQRDLKAGHFTDGLRGRSSPCPQLALLMHAGQASIALEMRSEGLLVAAGDVVFVDDVAHQVEGCANVDGRLVLLAFPCDCLEHVTSSASRWSVHPDVHPVALHGVRLRLPAMWTREADRRLLVVRAM